MNRLSLIIVHYKNEALLLDQLSNLDTKKNDIIVIDNSELLNEDDLPSRVKLLKTNFNGGFAAACNAGVANSTSDWLLFLNPDVLITSEEIDGWLNFAQSNNLDASSPLPQSDNYAKPLPSFYSLLQEFTPFSKILPKINTATTLTGGALLIKRSVLESLGGWDERFFLWFEDSDLTKRLIDQKYKIGFWNDKVNHLGGQSFVNLSSQLRKNIFFSSLTSYADKHLSLPTRILASLIKKRFSNTKALPSLNKKLISLVVPNLRADLLDEFLHKNFEFIDDENIELIIVSSGLNNKNIWQYRKRYPNVRFIALSSNNGFAKTVNIGFRAASGDFVGTLNDDTILTKNWHKPLIQRLKKYPGSVNPTILDKNGNIESAGINVLAHGKAEPITTTQRTEPYLTNATNGACVIYSKNALQKVGLFDEKFGSYLEDIDLSLRITRAGFKNSVMPESTITHLKHQTTNAIKLNKSWLDLKNWCLLIIKNWPWQLLLKNLPQILIERLKNFKGLVVSNKIASLKFLLIATLMTSFVFLRLYKIESSLWFFNDIGRDFIELYEWNKTGMPPLLGPQTSAVAYNQSAVYFYLLYPAYLLTGHSPFATIYTGVVFYLAMFAFGLYYLRKNKWYQNLLLGSFFIMTIHPQFIVQNRFVWNPTFISPLLFLSFFSYLKLKEKFTKQDLFVFSLTLALATSLNFSIAPLTIAFMLLALFDFWPKLNFIKIYLASIFAFLFWNLPTLAFELRHKFFLTKLLFTGEKIKQVSLSLPEKIHDLLFHTFYHLDTRLALLLTGLLSIFVAMTFIKRPQKRFFITRAALLLAITIAVTFAAPISIQSHYIFAFLTLMILLIASLHKWLLIFSIIILSAIWLRPTQMNEYFKTPYRTIEEQQSCAKLICQTETNPFFVSNQSDHHPYHNGMEWRYHFLENGCQVKLLDTQISEANLMAVVIDDSNYIHGQTAYNELTQFGKSQEIKRYNCEENLEVVILKKSTN